MKTTQIELLFSRRVHNSMHTILSPQKSLTFNQLKIYYEGREKILNNRFLETLNLLTLNGELNYAAYLLSDENGNSIKFAKYAGTTRADLAENEEYGYCCLVKAFDRLNDRLIAENKTFAKITPRRRVERKMIAPQALREAVLNALLHNDYTYGAPPKVELFSDRMEITSVGGLPLGVSQQDFFSGLSIPRNKELMRVFRDLDIVEHLGSGVPRILSSYDKSVFTIAESYIRVTFPFDKDFTYANTYANTYAESQVAEVNGMPEVLEYIRKNQGCRKLEIAEKLAINRRTLERYLKILSDRNDIEFRGAPKNGGYYVKS